MRKDFNVLMSDLNGNTEQKLVVTTAIVPMEDGPQYEVYAARVEMDDDEVRGVISYDSMEVALGKAVAQVMADAEGEEEDECDCGCYEDEFDYDYDGDYDEDEEEPEDKKEVCKDVLNKAVEEILKTLSQKNRPKSLSTRHIEALKAAIDEVGFDKVINTLEKIDNQ